MVEAGVGLEPLRPLPARALEEDRAEVALRRPQRRPPQAAQLLVLLARMQRVVDLAVLLRAARPRVRAREPVRVEALGVALVQVGADVAAGEQLGERLAGAARVRHPDGLAQPEPARRGGLADQRHAVGRERHQPVERAHARRAAHGGQEARRLLGGTLEVLGREGQDRRLLAAARPRPDRLCVDEPRLVVVIADAVGVADLAEVEVRVLVAQQRMRDLARLPGELGQRRGDRVLVDDRGEREPDAGEPRHLRAPDAGGEHDGARADPPARRLDGADLPALELEAGDLGVPEGLHPRRDRGARHRLRGLDGLGDAVGGDVEAADDPLRVDQRHERPDLLGREQRGGQPEGLRTAVAPVQLLPAGGGRGHLDAADGLERAERAEELDRLLGEQRHRRRRVVLEDEARRVRRRASGLPQRALVEQHDVAAAELGQVVRDAGPRDAAADDDDARGGGQGLVRNRAHAP